MNGEEAQGSEFNTPQEITYLNASSIFISRKVMSDFLNKVRNPEVGFGVVGMNTVIMGSSVFREHVVGASPATRPMHRTSLLGKGTMTTCLKDPDWEPKIVVMTC